MTICLPLERDVLIGCHGIAILNEPDKPLDEIPQEEKDDKHLLLLLDMNGLMPDSPVGYIGILAGEYHPYCCHCAESLEGNDVVIYCLHVTLFLRIRFQDKVRLYLPR